MRLYSRNCLLALAFALGAASNIPGASATFISIDFPGSSFTQTWGINAGGDIVGFYTTAGVTHGFLLGGGTYTTLDFPGAASTSLLSINPRGDIVGSYIIAGVTHGLLLKDGHFTTIDFPGAMSTELLGINPRGDVTGDYSTASLTPCCAAGTHGLLLSGGKFTSFDFPGSILTYGSGINAQDEIVGNYSNGMAHGYLLSGGKFTSFDFPGATFTNALGNNPQGDIVGRYTDSHGAVHGYLLSGGQFTSIDFPGSTFTRAAAINPEGDIVGTYIAGGVNHGYLLTAREPRPTRYTITDLGPVGGPPGAPYVITDNRLVSGAAATSTGAMRAVLWLNGLFGAGWTTDIGTLGGPNSAGFAINNAGQAVGQADTAIPDPYGEDFCGFKAFGLPSSGTTCLGFVWQNGAMTALPTLGGPSATANRINNEGVIAGYAENTARDPACPAPQRLEFKPVVWTDGAIQELPTYPGDNEGVAAWINDNGQVVGASGSCTALNPNTGYYLVENHALLWENGTVTDLGNLGGTGGIAGNHACAINNEGQVVGHSELTNNATFHGFLWTRNTGMKDLGTLPGDYASLALDINDSGEISGASLDANFNLRAVLWEGGVGFDLNDLAVNDSGLYLQMAAAINERGEIVGLGQTANGDPHAFVATPTDLGSAAAQNANRPATLSGAARKSIGQRLRFSAR